MRRIIFARLNYFFQHSVHLTLEKVYSTARRSKLVFQFFYCAAHQKGPPQNTPAPDTLSIYRIFHENAMPRSSTHTNPESQLVDLYEHPGHLLRRAQQISVSIFHDELGGDVTPVQYAVLRTLSQHPGIDQVSLAGLVAIDTSTGATVCVRLEEKGLLLREIIPHNRRQRALRLTPAGEQMLAQSIPGAQRLRKRLLEPLSQDEQEQFMYLLSKLVRLNNTQSRAPLAGPKDR